MTLFVDVPTLSKLVNRVGVGDFLIGMANTIEEDFHRWEDFDKCARVASHSDIGVIELMPIADNESYAFKYVNGHPANTAKGMLTVMAFGALAEVETGYPTFLSELTLTTAFRTAATSAVAAKAVAREDAKVMGMIGCGAQSEFMAIAFHRILGIEEVHIFDIDRHAVTKLKTNLRDFPSLRVVVADSAKDAVRGTDIVTTCTADKKWATILTPDMVEPGMHVNGVGGDCPGKTELHADILTNAKVFVEYEPQTRIEGDIQQLPDDFPVNDLWRVVAGDEQGRDSEEQITVFDSVGFALEDYSALRFVYALAERYGEGERIALVPDLEDPKNLYQRALGNDGRAVTQRVA